LHAHTHFPTGTTYACYPPGVAVGRPFLVDGQQRFAECTPTSASDKDGDDWLADGATVEIPTLSVVIPNATGTRARLARHWKRAAAAEHASIAAFSRHSLQLMALGAPRRLVQQTHEAALDEIRHAQMAYTLASVYGGADVGPGPLDIGGALDISPASNLADEVIRLTVCCACSHRPRYLHHCHQ
jgi:hypothetical protein